MTLFPILAPSDLVAPAVREFLIRKSDLINPELYQDDQGLFRIRSRCECCRSVSRASMRYPHAEISHARSLTHICYSMGLQGYLRPARRLSHLLARRHTFEEALEILGDRAPRAALMATVR